MKPLFILLLWIGIATAQPLTEKQSIDKSHIDFTTQYLYFVIHGQIEVDGHTFYNDTCKSPIIFQATIDGVTIIDTLTKQTYTHRKCGIAGCKIIHLTPVIATTPIYKSPWRLYQTPLELHNDNAIYP